MKSPIGPIIICLITFAGTLQVGAAEKDGQPPVAWGPETEGCRLSITTDQSSYRYGQPIKMRLTLENVGNKAVVVKYSPLQNFMYGHRFDISHRVRPLLPDGTLAKTGALPVPLTAEGKHQVGSIGWLHIAAKDLNPKQSDVTQIPTLNRLLDMTMRGEYYVTVYRRIFPQAGNNSKSVEIKSNTIRITVDGEKKQNDEQKNDENSDHDKGTEPEKRKRKAPPTY